MTYSQLTRFAGVDELTGGLGSKALAFFRFLASIEFPGGGQRGGQGDKCDDPVIRRRRALWIVHQRKRHAFMMERVRYEVMTKKRDLIRRARAQAYDAKAARHVGIPPLDAEPPSRGVGDAFDVPGFGAGHMAPDGKACSDALFEETMHVRRTATPSARARRAGCAEPPKHGGFGLQGVDYSAFCCY